MKRVKTLCCLAIFLGPCVVLSQPHMRMEDKIRIRESMLISEKYGDNIWKGINAIPFTIILVTDSIEFLIKHPSPSDDFKFLTEDSVLGAAIFYRKAQYPKHLLATFPAVKGVNCIVVGTPENTGKNSTEWILTVLHEHFHQYVYSQPDYYQSVAALDLAAGDQTGMWMLKYPFPYGNERINKQYQSYISALLSAITFKSNTSVLNAFKFERNKLKQIMAPADYRYFSFQLWQEGIARYTEYKFMELLKNYSPSKELITLKDFISFNEYKAVFYKAEINKLKHLSLKKDKRICFYTAGFAEGILLDKLNPAWKDKFFDRKFYLESYYSINLNN